MTEAADPALIGRRVAGKFVVEQFLGGGSMGAIYRARDESLDRTVALKVMHPAVAVDPAFVSRFHREARAASRLDHPNSMRVIEFGEEADGLLYIAMEFGEGDTLTTWLKRWPRSWREILEVFRQAGQGLVAAHSVGLLHRDFKPDNVLVGGDGRVRVTDFGLARSLVAYLDEESGRGGTPTMPTALSSPLTATGTVLGTPRYMAPEQLMGPDIDARADQFSFCVALHEALYGEHPLPGATSVSMLEKGDKAMTPPDGKGVPAPIVRAVARGLEKDRTKRFPTMAALMTELVPPAPTFTGKTIALLLGALLLVGAAAAAVVTRPDREAAPTSAEGTTEFFVAEINKLREEIRRLNRERQELVDTITKQKEVDLPQLRRQLEAKDREIQDLVKKVDVLQKNVSRPAAVEAVRKPPSQTFQVINAMVDAGSIFDNCFEEWAERRDELGNLHTEANLLIRFTVNPDGVPHSIAASGESSPSLRLCVELAVGRQTFPAGAEQLDLEVNVGWSQGMLNVAPRVVGRREAPRSNLDIR